MNDFAKAPDVKKYYRAYLTKEGQRFTLEFRHDSIDLAAIHAKLFAKMDGYTVEEVEFAGYVQPQQMGQYKEVA